MLHEKRHLPLHDVNRLITRMHAYSHYGLGDDSIDSGAILPDFSTIGGSFWGILGILAGGWILLKVFGVETGTTTTHYRKSSYRAKRSSIATPKASKAELSDLQQDVVDGLVGQGATKAWAMRAVRRARGSDFDSLFKSALRQH